MSNQQKKGKGVKSAKAERKEFDHALKQLNQETQVLEQEAVQTGNFEAFAVLTAAAPLYLFVVGVHEGNLLSNAPFLVAGVAISALTLYYFYRYIMNHKRESLLNNGGILSLALGEKTEIRKGLMRSVGQQSSYFSLFVVNFTHLLFYFMAIGYVLPSYQLSSSLTFLSASGIASLLSAFVLSVVAKVV